MTRWIGVAVVLAIMAGLPAAAAKSATKQQTSAMDIGAGRQHRHHDGARRSIPYEPHYYARPVYYRPYPYRVPAPFVFGFGPWW
ncbi:hypothetical protein IVB18_00580 [Bradyrhizobium sp. 186]|uniref:hypothetical protein n=1 Tax=Bradyrhizobium sp. 186 TaxID=2782654 RepID=UPI002000DEB0|nr:hypothetical protein [Bradyrhizobium sp. 186]UPK35913.1 hypothetical protein IVB18_00580 [Bradyrhizobium sp. 186]